MDKLAQSIEREEELAAELTRLKPQQSAHKIERAATLTKEATKPSNFLIDVQRVRAILNLRTALEIVTEVLRLKVDPGYGADPLIKVAPGVQSVMGAIGKGTFDSLDIRGITYTDAQAAVLAAVAPGGEVTPEDVAQALAKLFLELSKREWPGNVRKEIWLSHSEHAVAEVVAAMLLGGSSTAFSMPSISMAQGSRRQYRTWLTSQFSSPGPVILFIPSGVYLVHGILRRYSVPCGDLKISADSSVPLTRFLATCQEDRTHVSANASNDEPRGPSWTEAIWLPLHYLTRIFFPPASHSTLDSHRFIMLPALRTFRRLRSTAAPALIRRCVAGEKERKAKEAKIEKLKQEKERLETELSDCKAKAALSTKAYLSKISQLLTDAQEAQGDINLRNGLEIIAEVFRFHASVEYPNLHLAPGVQPVLNAIANGSFDVPDVTFAGCQADVIAALARRGYEEVMPEDATLALGTLYESVCRAELFGSSPSANGPSATTKI
ncbi:hypothetical protein C8R47DRAFT_1232600 [Mycena vitilis]|nr:hypothetical protein C8R47DRAFT_1232600 [Mycena vitilis]